MGSTKRRFATILATDCVGFSKHMSEDEVGTLESLKACREIIDSFIEKHGGAIFHTAGDSVLAEFNSPIESVHCAINFQNAIFDRNQLEGKLNLNWRVGIHCDDVIIEGDNVYGNGVNIAARLESQCHPGEVLISKLINEVITDRIEAISTAAGKKILKNISSDFEVFSISTKNSGLKKPVEKVEKPQVQQKRPVLSVLPFKNLNQNEDSSFLIDGIFEDITTELSMVRQLSIVSRQSSINFAESGASEEEFVKKFGVGYLITGNARSSGKKVRISVSLNQTSSGQILWSKKFDRALDDIFEVQDEIVRNVTQEILGEIELLSLQRAKRKPTENMNSYEFLLRGKELHHQFNKEANSEAIKMFDSAIKVDPNNAQAYAWKACTLGQAMVRQFSDMSMEQAFKEFNSLIQNAMKIDPNDFECHRLLSAIYSVTGDMGLSLEHGKKAYDLVPNDPRILQQYGEALLKTGDTKLGCDLTILALDYDPIAQGQTNSDKRKSDVVFACFMDGRDELCLKTAQEVHTLDHKTTLFAASAAYQMKKNIDELEWLKTRIKKSTKKDFEQIINNLQIKDLVIINTLRETLGSMILPII